MASPAQPMLISRNPPPDFDGIDSVIHALRVRSNSGSSSRASLQKVSHLTAVVIADLFSHFRITGVEIATRANMTDKTKIIFKDSIP